MANSVVHKTKQNVATKNFVPRDLSGQEDFATLKRKRCYCEVFTLKL